MPQVDLCVLRVSVPFKATVPDNSSGETANSRYRRIRYRHYGFHTMDKLAICVAVLHYPTGYCNLVCLMALLIAPASSPNALHYPPLKTLFSIYLNFIEIVSICSLIAGSNKTNCN